MAELFKAQGKYEKSSAIPTIAVNDHIRELAQSLGTPLDKDTKEIERKALWKMLIDQQVAKIPAPKDGEQPVYVATGGGYGANNNLVAHEKSEAGKKKLAENIVSLKGDLFRDLPIFDAEKNEMRKQIAAHLGEEAIKKNPNAVEQTLSAFYSDEMNTQIAKSAVIAALKAKKSVIYESASIYEDTVTRAMIAHQNGHKVVLLAGDKDTGKAIEELKAKIEPANIVTSYQKFSARFEKELVPMFDEVRVYNTDNEPKLIAEKKGKGQALDKTLDADAYTKFSDKATLDPAAFKSPTADANVILREHEENAKRKREMQQGAQEGMPKAPMMGVPMPKSAGVIPPPR